MKLKNMNLNVSFDTEDGIALFSYSLEGPQCCIIMSLQARDPGEPQQKEIYDK